MEFKDKIAWLRRYQDSKRLQRELERELEQLRSEATRVTPLLTGMPAGPSDGQSLPRAVERLIQAQQELQAQINQCGAVRREVVAVIHQVSDPRDHEILRRRYLLGQKFEEIAVEMPLDYSNVWRRHKKAIRKIAIQCNTEMC